MAWWDLGDKNAVNHFLETVQITETRFLDQPGLFDGILNSTDINELEKLAKLVINDVTFENEAFDYSFIPKKSIDDIPMEWFKAAERVLTGEKAILNANTVKHLAADAYRQKTYGVSR